MNCIPVDAKTITAKFYPEDKMLITRLVRCLDVSDPAHPEGLRHVVIRLTNYLLLRIFEWE
jgi:hypothetical protein